MPNEDQRAREGRRIVYRRRRTILCMPEHQFHSSVFGVLACDCGWWPVPARLSANTPIMPLNLYRPSKKDPR